MTVRFRTSNSLRAVVPVALSFLLSAASYAGVNYYYLDLNGATSGFGSLNTSWDTTSPAWTLSTAGTTVPVPHTFTSDRIYISASGWDYDVAVFGAGSTRGVLTIANDLKIELFGLVDNVGQTIAASGGGYIYLRGSPPAGITVAAGVNSLISAPIVIGSSNDTKFTVNGTLSITGALSSNGTGALIKDGTGTLILSGAGAYTGSFKVDRGTLRLTSQDAVSGSPYTISAGGALELQGGLSLTTVNTYSDGVSSAGAIISLSGTNQIAAVNLTFSPNKISVASGSVLTIGSIGGSTTYDLSIGGAGDVVISSGINVSILNKIGAGALTFSPGGSSVAASAFNIQGGTVTATTSSLPSASISLSGGDLAIEQDFAGTISRQLSGTGRLIKSGTGVLTISRFDNSFSGGVVVNSGTLRSGAAGALPAASAVSVAAGATLDLNGYAATISALSGTGSVQLGSALLTLSPTSSQTFAGVISGSGSVSKPTGFDLYLNADNTFTGLLTIGGGKVVINRSIAADVLLSPSGTLYFNRFDDFTYGGAVSGSGVVYKSGDGKLTLTGSNTFTGDLTITSGTLEVSAAAPLGAGSVTLSRGTLATTASFTSARPMTLATYPATSGTIDVLSGTELTWAGAISGGGSLVKTGAGTLTLSGTNTYTGTTTVSAGSLKLGSSSALAAGSQLVVAAGASVDYNGFSPSLAGVNLSPAGNETFPLSLSGAGSIKMNGSGTLTLAAANTNTGGVVVNSGTLRSGAAGALPAASAVSVAAGATLDLNGYAATISALSGTGSVQLGSALLTLSPTSSQTFAGVISGSGSVSKPTGFDLYLNADNTFTGLLTIGGGKVVINRSIAADVLLSPSGTLYFNRFDDFTYGGAVSGSGVVYKSGDGKLTLTGSNTFTGDLTITSGTLEVSAAAPLGAGSVTLSRGTLATTASFTSARPMTLATYPATSGTIDVLSGTELTWAGAISGGGSLVKTGAGTLTLSGTNTYTGTTTVSAGSLKTLSSSALGTGSVVVSQDAALRLMSIVTNQVTMENGGTLSGYGGAGSLTLNPGSLISPGDGLGSLSLASAVFKGPSTYVWQVSDSSGTAGVGYDSLVIGGAANFAQAGLVGGKINLKLVSLGAGQLPGNALNFSRSQIKQFSLIDASSFWFGTNANLSDIFNIDLSGFRYDDGSTTSSDLWSLQYDAANTAITLTAIPEPSSYGLSLGALALCVGIASRRQRKRG